MNAVLGPVSKALGAFETGGLAVQEFTAVFRVRAQGTRSTEDLRETLKLHDTSESSPYALVPGLHTARWVLAEQLEQPNGAAPSSAVPPGPLVFACTHDGDTQDFLYALVERCRGTLDKLLAYCDGFPVTADTDGYVSSFLAARQRANYFFDAVGASVSQVRRALELRSRFVDFVAEHQGRLAAELRVEFKRFSEEWSALNGALAYPFPLASPFEYPIDGESDWVRRTAELAHAQVLRDTRAARSTDPSVPARRAVHAKQHGYLDAEFVVRADLEPRLRRGIFVPGNKYSARVRFSNAASGLRPDWAPDARGMAIKLIGVPGRSLLEKPVPDGLTGVKAGSTQDFLLVSNPTFFIKDAHDYAVFRSIIDSRSPSDRALRLVAFGLRRPRESWIFARSLLRVPANPLHIEYHSMVAHLLGPNQAVKYSVRPTPGAGGRSGLLAVDFRSRNHLRESLRRTLDPATAAPVSLEFSVHVSERDQLPVEDPCVDWSRGGARRVPVATIVINPQDCCSDSRMKICEDAVFTPWHTRPEHRPLGSLSRVRLGVYQASAGTRSQLNQS